MQGKWISATLVVVGLLMSATVLAGDNKQRGNKHYNDHNGYGYARPGWQQSRPTPFSDHHYDRRRDHRYNDYHDSRHGYGYYGHHGRHDRYDRRVRVYPRHNPSRYYQQYRYQQHREHFHRHRPLLEIRARFNDYMHCPGHGGYFLVDDFFYR